VLQSLPRPVLRFFLKLVVSQMSLMMIYPMQLPLALHCLGHLPELQYHFYSLLHLQNVPLAILHPEELTGYQENLSSTLIMSKMMLIMQIQSSSLWSLPTVCLDQILATTNQL